MRKKEEEEKEGTERVSKKTCQGRIPGMTIKGGNALRLNGATVYVVR